MSLARAETLFESFVATAERHSAAVAIVDGERRVTYAELRAAADELHCALVEHGVEPGTLVGIGLHRGWRVVPAILAVLARGCGYVPLDPSYPAARLHFVAGDSGIDVAFADASLEGLPEDVICIDPNRADAGGRSVAPRVLRAPAGTPAYVIYTSGSTGTPKGVEVLEGGVLELFRSTDTLFDLSSSDVWTWLHSYSFDFSVWEVWGALLYGGRIVVVRPEVAARPRDLLRLAAAERVTVLSQVPTSFKFLVKAYEQEPLPLALRYVVFGGEALDRPSVRRWLRLRPGAETLVNMYGITETTVHCTFCRVDERLVATDRGGTNIGRPLPHLRVLVVDDLGHPVEPGEVGELYVGGRSLASGYLGRPELTAERFPLLELDGQLERWYRSGDLGMELPDGSLEYLGRNDRQVSLRGFRIELGEVEATLRRDLRVEDAIVAVEPAGGGEHVLIAYVVPADAAAGGELEEALRAALADTLPGHMVPNRVVATAEIPLTPSGKVDRARLRSATAVAR